MTCSDTSTRATWSWPSLGYSQNIGNGPTGLLLGVVSASLHIQALLVIPILGWG